MTDEHTVVRQRLGKYEIRREVGRGGMGVVYEGYDPIICRRVALKTLISELLTGAQADTFVVRLQREAQAAGRLNHPNIVAVYDFGEEPLATAEGSARIAYIAMEFIEGRELNKYLAQNERFPIPTVVRIMGQLLDALEYSHKNGVVHRDIKPSNIIILADGSVKVADFGIARIESSTLTQAGTILGSPSYMSPEQFLAQSIDGRSDLYSAGVVLYELLAGEAPFSGSFSNVMHRVLNDEPTPVSALNVHAPKGADALVTRALAKRPADRFQSAAEFKQAIVSELTEHTGAGTIASGAAVAPKPAVVEEVTMLRQTQPRVSRRTWSVIAGGALAVCAAAAFLTLRPAHGPESRGGANGVAVVAPSAHAVDAGTAAAPPTRAVDASAAAAPPEVAAPAQAGTAMITAVGLADPADPRFAQQAAPIERQVWGDARRQLIEKAVALYIDPSSINANYALLRDKLFSRSDQYISSVLEQRPPQLSQYGLMLGTIRATVKVRDVQRSLNEISRDGRVEFIRNNGNPRIAVEVRTQSDLADPIARAQRSELAENILMDRIRSYGFVAVDPSMADPGPDFLLRGEVRFKHLAATLPASGLTIEKVVLTSWTIRAIDAKAGQEVYLNTKIPQKQSWASEELALQDIGRLIASEFSRDFFLQYFEFGTQKVRLRFTGLPSTASTSLIAEATATLRILNAKTSGPASQQVVIDLDVAGGSDAATDLVQGALLNPLNRKLGQNCFTSTGSSGAELLIDFDPACATPAVLARLERWPPEALMDAPKSRLEEIVSDPSKLRQTAL